jgi:hypothetical protein
MAPRTVVPQKPIDLKAMRQLANFSASSAINTHDNKRLTNVSRIKLAVTVGAAFIGMFLLGLSVTMNAHAMMFSLALGAFGVAAFFGNNYIALTKKMTGARKSNMERHLTSGEETPADEPTGMQAGHVAEPSAETCGAL